MGPKFYLQFMFLTICAWLYVGVDNNWGQFNKTFTSVIYMPIDFMSKNNSHAYEVHFSNL